MSEYSPEDIARYKAENEKKIREAAVRGDVVIDGMPLKVTLEATADCDLFCRMCEFVVPRERGRKKGYALNMGLPEFEMLARQAMPGARFINLTVVGEPFLVPYLDRILELCREWQTRIEFITHGMHLSQEMIEKVGPHTQAMIISFDGATKRTFERVRVGATFETVTTNMLRFQRWRSRLSPGEHVPALMMAVTLMRENIEELPALVRLASVLGVDKVSAGWMIAFSDKMARSSCFRHKALANACLAEARRVAEELSVTIQLPAPFPGVSPEEVAAVTIAGPPPDADLVPHLKDALAGGPLPDAEGGVDLDQETIEKQMRAIEEWIPDAADLKHPTPSMEAPLESVSEDVVERQTAEERRLQAQVLSEAAGGKPEVFVPAEPPRKARYTCRFLWNELFVALNGDVAPCCIQGRPVVGNVFQQNLDQIWNGEAMQEMRRRLLEGDPIDCCRDCNYNTMLGQGEYREDTFFVPLDREV